MRKPWFEIIEVVEARGRSMADIVAGIAVKHRVTLIELRGSSKLQKVVDARREAYLAIRRERGDIPSERVGAFLDKEGSTVRHAWRRADQAAA